ncbi:GntR family transcriptional regulator [Dorea sp. D27]|uniref:GntR family transcriptional regulator n=1 Tax=Dorea sp. D27 TaxID=658665 RepID=UPI0006730AEC|nr:GntR family transcriptional regulator [Dorea sp. D27]KMZ53920.1 regulatory protein GntR, HTH [Dorea sp. D27]
MVNENLYEIVKDKICDEIFEGHFEDGDRIPPERELEEMLHVSRVTVRRSLEVLEEDGLVVREVGRGTRVTLRNVGNKGELDMVVLIAPARNPFFSEFIARFQNYAQEKGALLLYVEKPRKEELERCLYRLYKRGLRNVVVWLEDMTVDSDKLKRLRALGMNLVFFDSDKGLPYADCVALDNSLAVQALYEELERRGYKNVVYIGWNLQDAYSIRMREQTYRKKAGPAARLLTLPWKDAETGAAMLNELYGPGHEGMVDAVICSDRESGELTVETFKRLGPPVKIAAVDELSKNDSAGIIMYKQNLNAAVEQIFTSLQNQCGMAGRWKAELYLLEGTLEEGRMASDENGSVG